MMRCTRDASKLQNRLVAWLRLFIHVVIFFGTVAAAVGKVEHSHCPFCIHYLYICDLQSF